RLCTRITHSTEGRSGRAGRTGPRPSTDTCERVRREFRGLCQRLSPTSEQVLGRRRTRVPNPDGPVPAPRGDAPAVGAERDADHAGGVAPEGEDFLSGRRVPQLDGPVVATRGQAAAVRTGGEASDLFGVAAKVEHSPRGKVPDLQFTELEINTTGRGKSAVRKEHHASRYAGVSRMFAGLAGRILGIPDPHHPVAPARR